jgi:SAM-dependent methyltransferase
MTIPEDSGDRARALWEAKAREWDEWTGEEGDWNRRFQSDPVLWRMLGEVRGLEVLDAGCGTGYLTVELAREDARVIAVDWSEEMVRITRERAAAAGIEADVHLDDCMTLRTVLDSSVDAVLSNYVLMDLPDLDAACAAMARILRPGGKAVVVVNHPCLCPPGGVERLDDGSVRFRWHRSYLDEYEFTEEWGPFTTPFQGYHRPLGRYWGAFHEAGLTVTDFDEPVVPSDPPPQGVDAERVARCRMTPYSVAFELRRG